MKKATFFIFVIASVFIINNLAQSIYNLWHKQDLLVKAKKELGQEKAKNIELKNRLEKVGKQEFVEEEARNKLFMVKPGEKLVILPSGVMGARDQQKKTEEMPNWKKWWQLFF